MDPITATLTGLITSSIAFSPVEWAVHRELMHVAPKERPNRHLLKGLRNRASAAHQDEHHRAYMAPEHYYRDLSNEHVVVHFARKDIGYIVGSTGIVSSAISAATNSVVNGELAINPYYVAGSMVASAAYYAAYEFTHHYMHVIGERRHNILTQFGNIVQGNKPDGKLRFSKPLLDDICNEVEDWVDAKLKNKARSDKFVMPVPIQERYLEQTRKIPAQVAVADVAYSSNDVFENLADVMLAAEVEKRSDMSMKQRFMYGADRQLQRSLRRSPTFSKLDNHHFIHHSKWLKNLNVVAPLADYMFGTKVDSSRATLDATPAYWLCPNSVDTVPFKR